MYCVLISCNYLRSFLFRFCRVFRLFTYSVERSIATDAFLDYALTGDVATLKGGRGAIVGAFLRSRGKKLLDGRLGLN